LNIEQGIFNNEVEIFNPVLSFWGYCQRICTV